MAVMAGFLPNDVPSLRNDVNIANSTMPINLTKTLKAKQAESKLSNEALAKAIGVSTVSVSGVLKGKSKPNATTAKKYAAYLGIDIAELGAKPAKAGAKADKPRKAKAAKRAAKTGRSVAAKGLGAELVSAVSAAAAVLDDQLALAVHKAGKMERSLIARLLNVG